MLQPRDCHFHSLSAHGFHRVAYRDWGHPLCPRVVVCVHGLTRNGRDFDTLAAALCDRFRLLCPDMPGRGESDWLPDANDYGFPTYLTTLTALLAHADVERVAWVGTSMGGLLGMVIAAQANTPVTRLVLNDVGPVIAPAALARIGAYVGLDPVFDTFAALEAHIRAVSAPFGTLTDAQWTELARTHGAADRRRTLAAQVRSRHRGPVSQCQRSRAGPLGGLGCDPLPDPAAARRRVGPARGRYRRRNADARAAAEHGRVRRRRPCTDAPQRRPDRAGRRLPGVCLATRSAKPGRIVYNRGEKPAHASVMALALSLPALEARPANPPETRPARVQPWLEETLKRDPIDAAGIIGDALAATNRVAVSEPRRLELAERYYGTRAHAVAESRTPFRARPPPAERQRADRSQGGADTFKRTRDRVQAFACP